jgi:nucleotide-binding universal stress UspA family protein
MNTSSSWTSLLVHADASEQFAPRLRVALRLARQMGVTLDALYAVTNPATALSFSFGSALGAGYGNYGTDGAMVEALLQAEAEQRKRSRAVFDRARVDEPDERVSVHWQESTGDPVSAMVDSAWAADLLVLGQHDPSKPAPGVPASFVSDVLLASGKPAVVVPYIGAGDAMGNSVVLAWKPTPEAARAVAAALPLLRHAQTVHLALWDEAPSHRVLASSANIEKLLRRHGVQVRVLRQGPPSHELGEHVLSLCADVQADLLVMGCYSHSRARERLLGGVTSTVLQSMTVPVLMSH